MENRFWRKIVLFGIMIAVTFMLAACGDDDDDTPAAPASSDQSSDDQPAEGDNEENPPDGGSPEASAVVPMPTASPAIRPGAVFNTHPDHR